MRAVGPSLEDQLSVALVVNPQAGGGLGRRVLRDALPILRSHGIEPAIHVCTDGTEPTRRTQQAVADGAELVVAVGGDGQAAAVAAGLLGTDAQLGLLPAGSANDFARAVGVPRNDVAAAVRLLIEQRTQRIDVVRVDAPDGVRHFLNVGGTGFDAVVARRAEQIPLLRGAGRYVLAVLSELPTFQAGRFRLTIDGVEHSLEAMMIAIANGSTYGGGMRVAPGALLNSGRLEICIVRRLSRARFLRAFPLVFNGSHVDHPQVTMLHGCRIEIAADREFGVTGDGELIGRLPASFQVLAGVLPVVVAS
jgi:diacylglycerol kinase (ATP)